MVGLGVVVGAVVGAGVVVGVGVVVGANVVGAGLLLLHPTISAAAVVPAPAINVRRDRALSMRSFSFFSRMGLPGCRSLNLHRHMEQRKP